jgi:hypothetical protein
MSGISDDDLLGLLGRSFDDDLANVPDTLHSFALDAEQWIDVAGELAQLVSDSWANEVLGARAEGDLGQRVLIFSGDQLSVELSIDGAIVVGQLMPPGIAEIVVEPKGDLNNTADELGRFRIDGVETPFRLTIVNESGRVTTPWITA